MIPYKNIKVLLPPPPKTWRKLLHKLYGLLVLLGYDITAFTPVAYQRGSLPRPLKEISSCGGFRAYMLSALIPSRRSYPAVPLARQQVH